MTKKNPKFLRSDSKKYSKLGVRRKKKQIYRKSKGRDNKIRLKMKGHLRNVSVGFRSPRKTRGLIEGKTPVLVHNLKELKNIKEKEIGIIARIGDKKKKELAEYASKEKIKLVNLNPKKFLKNLEFKLKKRKEAKQEKHKIKASKDKKKEKKDKTEKKEEQKTEEKTTENVKGENKGDLEKDEAKQEQSKADKVDVDTNRPKTKTDNKKQIQTNNYGRGK